MSGPAFEAAKRLCDEMGIRSAGDRALAQSAAAEALDPIRKFHDDMFDLSHRNGFSDSHQEGMRYVLHALAPHIFTTEELER